MGWMMPSCFPRCFFGFADGRHFTNILFGDKTRETDSEATQAIQQQVQPRDFELEIHKLHNELRSYPTVRFFCCSFFWLPNGKS